MPSDHVIKDEPGFVEAVRRAVKMSATGKLVLFGITPEGPHTGYGYIRRGAPLAGFDGAYGRRCVHRKARQVDSGALRAADEYIWNSGIFVLALAPLWTSSARLEPDILEAAREALAKPRKTWASCASIAKRFASASSISDRLRGDGADWHRRRAAPRHRLERRRLLVVAVGAGAARRTRQRRRGRRPAGIHARTATSIPSARWSPPSASRIWSSSIHPTRCSLPTVQGAGRLADRRAASGRSEPQGAASSTCAATARGATSRR